MTHVDFVNISCKHVAEHSVRKLLNNQISMNLKVAELKHNTKRFIPDSE